MQSLFERQAVIRLNIEHLERRLKDLEPIVEAAKIAQEQMGDISDHDLELKKAQDELQKERQKKRQEMLDSIERGEQFLQELYKKSLDNPGGGNVPGPWGSQPPP